MSKNYALLLQLLMEYAIKSQAAAQLLNQAAAEDRDVTDDEVDQSDLRRDAALARLGQAISGA